MHAVNLTDSAERMLTLPISADESRDDWRERIRSMADAVAGGDDRRPTDVNLLEWLEDQGVPTAWLAPRGDASQPTPISRPSTKPANPPLKPKRHMEGTPLDRWVLTYRLAAEHQLTSSECAVLLCVAFHDGGHGCRASLHTMHEETRLNRRVIIAALKRLQAVQVIGRDTSPDPRRGKPVVYRYRPSAYLHPVD